MFLLSTEATPLFRSSASAGHNIQYPLSWIAQQKTAPYSPVVIALKEKVNRERNVGRDENKLYRRQIVSGVDVGLSCLGSAGRAEGLNVHGHTIQVFCEARCTVLHTDSGISRCFRLMTRISPGIAWAMN
jgi:hypothetical protein